MEGFLLRLFRFITEFQTLMVIILLTQKSPHLITIFVKLRLNAKKNLLLRKIIITATMMIILIMIMIIVITVKWYYYYYYYYYYYNNIIPIIINIFGFFPEQKCFLLISEILFLSTYVKNIEL